MTTIASQSPASRLCTQPFIQTQIKENIKAPRHWLLCGEFTGTGEFPAQRASNAENVSIWWRHHVLFISNVYAYITWFIYLVQHTNFFGIICKQMPWQWRHMRVMSPNSLVTRLFVQQFAQINNKRSTKAPHYWPFMRRICLTGAFLSQKATSNEESVSIPWQPVYDVRLLTTGWSVTDNNWLIHTVKPLI